MSAQFAIALLSRSIPHPLAIAFFETLRRDNYDLYIVLDDSTVTPPVSDTIKYVQLADSLCREEGWVNAAFTIPKVPSAWDKVLRYFCCSANYDHVWILEDDVFVPTANTIADIDAKHPSADMLSAANGMNTTGRMDWLWNHAVGKIALPWACSMVCAVRLSRRLLKCIREYVEKHRTLLFIEFMFNTLALHNGFVVECPPELKEIIYMRSTPLANIDPTWLYHPVKSIHGQVALRQTVSADHT
jgi:hypothetical protein